MSAQGSSLVTGPPESSSLRTPQQVIQNRHIIVVYGPAGCGKTSNAKYIAEIFGLKFMEGDEYHSPAAIEKMAAGIPLEDADRWEWLARLRDAATDSLAEKDVRGVVMTCSALKQRYRDVLRGANDETQGISVHFILLSADRKTLEARLSSRIGHFMPPGMLDSQLRTLQPVGRNETDIVVVDARGGRQETEAKVAEAVRLHKLRAE
ncbi:putative glucokinase [Venturia nashicola]|uniref:Gluconokinase n=1 Tax=Venturia nashicola TaxID=86259 RepID=A0A4Z1PQU0_9PEZI|nr:putative glucokinase [Venturia nashicola]TLD37297.1 putative glucokinase [Venturia nashicola]